MSRLLFRDLLVSGVQVTPYSKEVKTKGRVDTAEFIPIVIDYCEYDVNTRLGSYQEASPMLKRAATTFRHMGRECSGRSHSSFPALTCFDFGAISYLVMLDLNWR